jgi:hypothetical protein
METGRDQAKGALAIWKLDLRGGGKEVRLKRKDMSKDNIALRARLLYVSLPLG